MTEGSKKIPNNSETLFVRRLVHFCKRPYLTSYVLECDSLFLYKIREVFIDNLISTFIKPSERMSLNIIRKFDVP